MTEEKFEVGDVVRLKSGGPVMTISALRDGGAADCSWFDSKNHPMQQTFNVRLLEKSHPPRTGWGSVEIVRG